MCLSGLALLLIAVLAAGCAHSSRDAKRVGGLAEPPVPQAPLFLTGPMALLFTNVDGFRARVVLEEGASARQVAAGELMGRSGRLIFAPALSTVGGKRIPPLAPPSSGMSLATGATS